MTASSLALLVVAAAAAGVDWWAVAARNRAAEYVAKPLVMMALITAALALVPATVAARTWFVVALALCLVGDVLLMLERERFLGGLVAFLLGHLAYIGGLVAAGVRPWALTIGVAVVAAAVATVGRRIAAGTAATTPGMLAPVWSYVIVISAMLATAIGTAHPLAIAGAGSFYTSDALLGWNRFVRPMPHGRIAVIVTYHVGQALLVLALIGLES